MVYLQRDPLLEEQCIFYSVLYFIWLVFLWELYLLRRQRNIYKEVQAVPEELQEAISTKTFEKARLYALNRSAFTIIMDVTNLLITTEMLLLDGFSFFWKFSKFIIATLGHKGYSEILISVMFVLLTNAFGALINLPFSIYHTFVLEEKFGFNKETFKMFIEDEIIVFVLGHIVFIPIVVIFVYMLKTGGDYIFIYLCLFTLVINLLILIIYPDYIQPLLTKSTPLPDGNLKTRIEELAGSVGFPLYQVYIVEASKRSTHSNAYLYGFSSNKRIVLYDTLLRDYVPENESASSQEDVTSGEKRGCDDDEVLAILSHELGHWKLNHSPKLIIIMLLNLTIIFWLLARLFKYNPMYHAFGFHDERPVLIGLLLAVNFIISPYMVIVSFFLNVLSRHFEFQADGFVKTLDKSQFLRSALIKLYEDNLIYPEYDWLYSMWHHSHPPLLERLRALKDKED